VEASYQVRNQPRFIRPKGLQIAHSYDEITFARTTPEQKLRIVRTFQAEGCTVAVTGDGVNDAPALKQADVGVAIGGGAEVAIEAADLVLLDSFSAIIKGIELGRLVFDNLRKVIAYLLPAGTFAELWAVLISILFGVPQPLNNLQMIISASTSCWLRPATLARALLHSLRWYRHLCCYGTFLPSRLCIVR
jgi:magnesium-transporting ATPase (P-type)